MSDIIEDVVVDDKPKKKPRGKPFKKGTSGNLKGRPKLRLKKVTDKEFDMILARGTRQALEVVMDMMGCDDPKVALKAAIKWIEEDRIARERRKLERKRKRDEKDEFEDQKLEDREPVFSIVK